MPPSLPVHGDNSTLDPLYVTEDDALGARNIIRARKFEQLKNLVQLQKNKMIVAEHACWRRRSVRVDLKRCGAWLGVDGRRRAARLKAVVRLVLDRYGVGPVSLTVPKWPAENRLDWSRRPEAGAMPAMNAECGAAQARRAGDNDRAGVSSEQRIHFRSTLALGQGHRRAVDAQPGMPSRPPTFSKELAKEQP